MSPILCLVQAQASSEYKAGLRGPLIEKKELLLEEEEEKKRTECNDIRRTYGAGELTRDDFKIISEKKVCDRPHMTLVDLCCTEVLNHPKYDYYGEDDIATIVKKHFGPTSASPTQTGEFSVVECINGTLNKKTTDHKSDGTKSTTYDQPCASGECSNAHVKGDDFCKAREGHCKRSSNGKLSEWNVWMTQLCLKTCNDWCIRSSSSSSNSSGMCLNNAGNAYCKNNEKMCKSKFLGNFMTKHCAKTCNSC